MEGVSAEAASLAGHLKLGRLIVLYDSNDISLDGELHMSFSESVADRFKAYGWHYLLVEDGNDLEAINEAIRLAKEANCPSLIEVKTTIGYGSPNKGGKSAAHGAPLGREEIKKTKENYRWAHSEEFHVPADVRTHFEKVKQNGDEKVRLWTNLVEQYQQQFPKLGEQLVFTDGKNLKVARFGDNMREVAVTEGDKVEAQIKFGWSISGFGIGDLVQRMKDISEQEVQALYEQYNELYEIDPKANSSTDYRNSILEQARIELGMKAFLVEGGFSAFTTNFEDLHGMKQLPGLAVQRLMEQGYGFGGEGDWKTAALLRMMKIIAGGKGTSFMEDYTYHLEAGNELVLGSHMLEVCPTIAANRPKIQVHPLGIGGKQDPARMVFDGDAGRALNASIIDIGNRFRLVVNEVDAVKPLKEMPNLPVAKVLWKPQPSLSEAAEAWIHAGGAHHTVFSFKVTPQQLFDWSIMTDIECVFINNSTNIMTFQNELRWNDIARKF